MSDLPPLGRLRWDCRRGMLELDLILLPFLDQQFAELDLADQKLFVELLACEDQDLFMWLVAKTQDPAPRFANLVQRICNHANP